MPSRPASCCVERQRTIGSIRLDERYWDCRGCLPGTRFPDGCVSVDGLGAHV